jgi:hypothetical protein
MEGKNVIYLIALVVAILCITLLFVYNPNLKNFFQNADTSSDLVDNIEKNIDNDSTNNVETKPISKTAADVFAKIQQKKNEKNPNLNTPLNIKEALNSLVVEKYNGTNENAVDSDAPFMEFSVSKLPTIDINSNTETYKDLSYTIMGWLNNDYGGHLSLLENTTPFDASLGSRTSVEITFRYSDDYRKNERDTMTQHATRQAEFDYIAENYGKETRLLQGVKFFMWDVKFKKPLKMPQKITIWNEYSKDVFPCYLDQNEFVHLGASFTSEYKCPKLPNFNDYGGTLKIILN